LVVQDVLVCAVLVVAAAGSLRHAHARPLLRAHAPTHTTHARARLLRRPQVIIAGAGGAAHLPGMVAALTPLPVVGVPVKPAGAYLDGVDALLSICQMPKGVPVATVAIGNAANAGLLAVRILASTDPALLQKMLDYQEGMKRMVLDKAAKLEASSAAR
jgi:phosphoribosylaminoimidazole carboxylase PurE protein